MLRFLLKSLATGHFPVHWPTSLAVRTGSQICNHIRVSCSVARRWLDWGVQPCSRVSTLEHAPQLVSSHSKNADYQV